MSNRDKIIQIAVFEPYEYNELIGNIGQIWLEYHFRSCPHSKARWESSAVFWDWFKLQWLEVEKSTLIQTGFHAVETNETNEMHAHAIKQALHHYSNALVRFYYPCKAVIKAIQAEDDRKQFEPLYQLLKEINNETLETSK